MTLYLSESSISTLPSSIEELENLKTLDLSWSTQLSKLPEEIGNLKNIESLLLNNTDSLESLPGTVGGIASLEVIDLSGSKILSSAQVSSLEQLFYSLSYNRAKYQTGFGDTRNKSTAIALRLWPLVLDNAKNAFSLGCDVCGLDEFGFDIDKPTALYTLLDVGRESLI